MFSTNLRSTVDNSATSYTPVLPSAAPANSIIEEARQAAPAIETLTVSEAPKSPEEQFTEATRIQYGQWHKKVAHQDIQEAQVNSDLMLPSQAYAQYLIDLSIVHGTISSRFQALADDAVYAPIVNFEFVSDSNRKVTLSDFFKVDAKRDFNAYQADLTSLKDFCPDVEERAPTEGAQAIVKWLSSSPVGTFLNQSYIILSAGPFGGQFAKEGLEKRYQGKVTANSLSYPQVCGEDSDPLKRISETRKVVDRYKILMSQYSNEVQQKQDGIAIYAMFYTMQEQQWNSALAKLKTA